MPKEVKERWNMTVSEDTAIELREYMNRYNITNYDVLMKNLLIKAKLFSKQNVSRETIHRGGRQCL